MKEEHTSGTKQFFIVIGISAVLYLACAVMMSLFGSYAFIGGIISVLVFCVFGYFVLTHYTARFTYSLKDGRLRINRMIGKRNKEYEFPCSAITRTAFGVKPYGFPKPIHNMKINIASKKNCLYIEYKNKSGESEAVAIGPSDKLRRRIDKERKKTDA